MKHCLLLVFMMSIGVLSEPCWGQQTPERFLVITYERNAKSEGALNLEYFWILPYDRLDSKPLHIFPFAFGDEQTRYQGKEVSEDFKAKIHYPDNGNLPILQGDVLADNLNGLSKAELYNYIATTNNANSDFLKTVFLNRKKVQKCSKKWQSRGKETLIVYITPVRADFKKGWLYSFDGNYSFYGYAYYLDSTIEYDESFWEELYSKRITLEDYSYVFYAKYASIYSSEDCINDYIVF